MKKLIFAALVAAFATGCSQVDSGEAALRSVWGNIEGETIQPGLVWHNPLSTDIIVYDCRFRLADYRMESYTKDMQQATLGVAFNYAIDPSRLRELHIKYGLQYGSKILDPIVYGAVKDVIGNWEAAELVHSREKATTQIVAKIQESIRTMPVLVRDINLTNIDFSDVFEKSIEEKQVQQQRALAAKNKTAEIEELARQRLITAESEAKAMQIKGDALRANHGLVELEAVNRWDGKMPQTLMLGENSKTFLPVK